VIYDPEDIEKYAPLWSWEPGLYAHFVGGQGARAEAPLACQVYVPAKVQARSSWVTIELRACIAPVFLAAQQDGMSVVKRVQISPQRFDRWSLFDLVVTESHLSTLTKRSRILKRYGNLATAITRWPDDPEVRAACETQESRTVMIVSDTESIVELPRLDNDEDFLPQVVQILQDMLGAEATTWDNELAFQSTYYGTRLAFREGNLTPYGSRFRVRVPIGQGEAHRPPEYSRWIQRELSALATTDVHRSKIAGTIRLTAIPPHTISEVRLFNERLALSPVHLLSWEILRVVNVLRLTRHWLDVCEDVELWTPAARAANLVEDLVLRRQFLCVDAATECFQPILHPWSKP
jgi:hypothetical protein